MSRMGYWGPPSRGNAGGQKGGGGVLAMQIRMYTPKHQEQHQEQHQAEISYL